MKELALYVLVLCTCFSCHQKQVPEPSVVQNPEIELSVPVGFPELNASVDKNPPTVYGVVLGQKLFNEKRFSSNNTISCGSCHNQSYAFTDQLPKAKGVYDRIGLRNTPPIQNLAFMRFYNWDGNILELERQPLIPIITHAEMDASIVEIIHKLEADPHYAELFEKAFGDQGITADRIYRSLAQYQYTLISANSKYDQVKRGEAVSFTESEARGYISFQQKCMSCHSTELFTDQSFRNIGFPINPSAEEAGRARVTGELEDLMCFRVPSLRNAGYTAPYGSFGQFATLKAVLDYLDTGVLFADNLDPILKNNGNRIPLSEEEKEDLIAFIQTLNDPFFVEEKEP